MNVHVLITCRETVGCSIHASVMYYLSEQKTYRNVADKNDDFVKR